MNDEFDLSEIEERLYGQLYHTAEESIENQSKEQNVAITNMNFKKRYFNTSVNPGIQNISLRINVQNQVNQGHTQRYVRTNVLPKNKKMWKPFKKQKVIQNIPDYDYIDLKEIKTRVDNCPEFINCLPQHIRKKLKKMNKRIAFIEKKKYLDAMTKFNSNKKSVMHNTKGLTDSINTRIKCIKIEPTLEANIISKQINNTIISISDDEIEDSKVKYTEKSNSDRIELLSSDDEKLANGTTKNRSIFETIVQTPNENDFKRPDDDVIFVEPTAIDIIDLENDTESNWSLSTKSSIDRFSNNKQARSEKHTLGHAEAKELLNTSESNNSNDFLESTLPPDNLSSWKFNCEVYGADFGPTKHSTNKLNVKDLSGSESSCSVAACDLGGLLASSNCALFNEVDFESPSKNIFEESNLASFGDFITPNRVGIQTTKNILHSSPVIDEVVESSSRKKIQNEKLPNLSTIDPEATGDLEASLLIENELSSLRNKKKRKTKKLVDINTKTDGDNNDMDSIFESGLTKKSRITEPDFDFVKDAEEGKEIDRISTVNTVLKLKKKHKVQVQVDNQEGMLAETEPFEENLSQLSDSQTKRKRKNKKSCFANINDAEMESGVQVMSGDISSIGLEKLLKKKKSRKCFHAENNQNSAIDVQIVDGSSSAEASNLLTEYELKKKKNKKVSNQVDTDGNEITRSKDDERDKRKYKKKKSLISLDNDKNQLQNVQDTSNIDTLRKAELMKKKAKMNIVRDQFGVDILNDEIIDNCVPIVDYSLELSDVTKKKRRTSKFLVSQIVDTCDAEATYEAKISKRKRRRIKSTTSDMSTITDSSIDTERSNVLAVTGADQIESTTLATHNNNIDADERMVNIQVKPCMSSGLLIDKENNFETSVIDIDDSLIKPPSKESDSNIIVSDAVIVISDSDSDSDYDFSNVKDDGGNIQVANVMVMGTRKTIDLDERDHLESIFNKMTDDSSKWRIISADRHPIQKSPKSKLRCRKCREFGHYANQCKIKLIDKCSLCSRRGHMEPRCPNKLCTNCGWRSKFFTTFCSRCAHTKYSLCRICNMRGHDKYMCPDLWRRYHLTIVDGPIVRPATYAIPSIKWCSGCGKYGHLECICQYFARDHYPTVAHVVGYEDHLNKGRHPETNLKCSGTRLPLISPSKVISAPEWPVNANNSSSLEASAPRPDIVIEESKIRAQHINTSLEIVSNSSSTFRSFIDIKSPIFKTILPVPQPIGSSSVKHEIGSDVLTKNPPLDPLLPIPPSQFKCPQFYQQSLFLFSPPTFTSEQSSTFPFSTELHVSYLNAKYLRFCEDGTYAINELCAIGTVDIQIYKDGQINIQCGLEGSCTSIKSAIFDHLLNIPQLLIPTENLRIICFLEEILMDLTKKYTIDNLKTSLTVIQDGTLTNKSISFQRLNMMIYGCYKWEYGERYIERVKEILITVKESDNINGCLRNELKECFQYLIECVRPIPMYQDIIDNIAEGKSNFFNVSSLRIPEDQPSQKSFRIEIDPMKYDYVKISFPARFMIYRWKTKLDVTFSNDNHKLTLCLMGNEKDVDSAVAEYRTVVGEDGDALPLAKSAIFDIVSSLLNQVQSLEPACDNLKESIMHEIVFSSVLSDDNKHQLKKLHVHLIVVRGLNGGREKMLILQEFIDNFKASSHNDYLSEHIRNQIQDAVNTIQFNANTALSDYKELYFSANRTNIDKMILDIDDYNTLKDAKVYCPWHDKIKFSSSEIINSKHMSVSIIGTNEDRCNFKIFIFNYLDRIHMLDSNPKSLRMKIEDALKQLWSTSFKINTVHLLLNRIHLIESTTINSYHIEILRKLYQQLHIYFFGCCRLDMRTGAEMYSNNYVDTLRAFIAYLDTVNVVPIDIQMHIYRIYTYIFGKEKLKEVKYKSLNKSAWILYKKYKEIDQNTIFICDPKFKIYLTKSAYSLMSYSTIKTNPLMQCKHTQTFVNQSFLIIVNTNPSINYNLPILIRSESFKLFSDTYSNIFANISISLQTIEDITSTLNKNNVLELLNDVHYLEENSPNSELIDYKYQVMNIYFFGCCQLMDGLYHLNTLKIWQEHFSQPDKATYYITDYNLMNMLITSYEYIFWKGKKPEIHYNILSYQSSITSDNIVTTIPLPSNYICDYFIHARQGIDLIQECSRRGNIVIVEEQVKDNTACINVTGGDSKTLPSVIALLLYEIDQISIFKDIPFRVVQLYNYLNHKIEEVLNAENNLIPITILHEMEAINQQLDPSMPYTEYLQLCSRKELLCYQLNKFVFGVCPSADGQTHLVTLARYAAELERNPNIIIDKNQMHIVHKSLKYIFWQKLSTADYRKSLEFYVNQKKCENMAMRINLLPQVYHFLERLNGTSNSLISRMQLQFNCTTPTFPYVMVSGSNSHLSWVRDVFCQFNIILSKIPKTRCELIIFLDKSLMQMLEVNDPKELWTKICTFEECDSNEANSTELKNLYAKLHKCLFGYHRLGNGKALRQILNQHLINLQMTCKTSDVISIEILQEVYFALQYIEGSKKQFSSQEYEDFVNKSCIISTGININKIVLKKDIEMPPPAYKESEVQGIETTDVSDQQYISLVQKDHSSLLEKQNILKNINSDVRKKESSGNFCAQVAIEPNLQIVNQICTAPNINIRNDCIQAHVNIPKGFHVYLKRINSGKLLLNELKGLVQLEVLPRKIVLVGTTRNINIAKKSLNQHTKSKCFRLRYIIFLNMVDLRRQKHVDIFSIYRNAFVNKEKMTLQLWKRLHIYLFGILKLNEGQYHLDVLTKFLNCNVLITKKGLVAVNKSREYIFCASTKRINYESIIQTVISKGIGKG